LAKVDRVTRTQIIIGEARYNRSDGTLRGQSIWQATVRVSIPTDEEKARALLKQKRMSVLRSLERLRGNVDSLPEETLDTIIKLGKKPEGV
jgi:tagatose-1,6-bisphosphate aldolase